MGDVSGKNGLVDAPARGVVARRQGPQRVPVVRLAPGDEARASRLRRGQFGEVLPRHLECGLDGFGSRAGEEDFTHDPAGRVRQELGELLDGRRGEEGVVGVGHAVELVGHGLLDAGVVVPDGHDRGAGAGVDDAGSVGGLEEGAGAGDDCLR